MSRAAFLFAGVSALVPVALAQAASPPAPPAAEAFVAPDSRLVVTRTVHRALSDGKEIVSSRSYAVRFVPEDGGYRVEGELISCEVNAPPALKAIAALEQARRDTGLFPFHVDRAGRILGKNDVADRAAQREGEKVAEVRIGASHLAQVDKEEALAFVRQLVGRGGSAPWPTDLFHPVSGERSIKQDVALPGGQSGTVTVSTRAAMARGRDLSGTMERVVVTDLGGDRREVRESWSLGPS